MRPTPYLDGFRAGVKPPPEELEFDTSHEVSMSDSAPPPDYEQLAKRWRCSSKTVRRMHDLGIDVLDPVEVGIHLSQIRSPAEPMIDAVLDELSTD
jgi:hypothetical protein